MEVVLGFLLPGWPRTSTGRENEGAPGALVIWWVENLYNAGHRPRQCHRWVALSISWDDALKTWPLDFPHGRSLPCLSLLSTSLSPQEISSIGRQGSSTIFITARRHKWHLDLWLWIILHRIRSRCLCKGLNACIVCGGQEIVLNTPQAYLAHIWNVIFGSRKLTPLICMCVEQFLWQKIPWCASDRDSRESNSGPLVRDARVIPLDHHPSLYACHVLFLHM